MSLPNNFNELCMYLDYTHNFNNILFVRHLTGGEFLDSLFIGRNVTRLLYITNNSEQEFRDIGSNILIHHNDLENILTQTNKTYDLICLDSFHEINESISDFTLLTRFLNENGVLICHDCSPPTKSHAISKYVKGPWCGVTYAAFVLLAYSNPDWFYSIIDRDHGLGIVSKKQINFVKKICNNQLQQMFLSIFFNNNDEGYDFFKIHSNEMVNLIN